MFLPIFKVGESQHQASRNYSCYFYWSSVDRYNVLLRFNCLPVITRLYFSQCLKGGQACPAECWIHLDDQVAPRRQGTTVSQGKLGMPGCLSNTCFSCTVWNINLQVMKKASPIERYCQDRYRYSTQTQCVCVCVCVILVFQSSRDKAPVHCIASGPVNSVLLQHNQSVLWAISSTKCWAMPQS